MSHVDEQVELYVAGALTPGEQSAFESHVAGCPACAERVAQMRDVDAAMCDLFHDARPTDDFEARTIAALNLPRRLDYEERPQKIKPQFREGQDWGWIKLATAAVLMLGGLAMVATAVLGHKTSAMIGTLAAILPGNETADSGAMTSGSLIETTNDQGTIQINSAPATDSSNSDRLDFNTGLSNVETGNSVLALDVDSTT